MFNASEAPEIWLETHTILPCHLMPYARRGAFYLRNLHLDPAILRASMTSPSTTFVLTKRLVSIDWLAICTAKRSSFPIFDHTSFRSLQERIG